MPIVTHSRRTVNLGTSPSESDIGCIQHLGPRELVSMWWPDALLPLWGFVALSAVMAWAWHRQRSTHNAGIVDVLWSAGLGALAVSYAAFSHGWPPRRILVATLVGVWSVRLSLHLGRRVAREREDGRYADLRRRLGSRFDRVMFWYFQSQALLAVLLSIAFLVPCSAAAVGLGAREVVAVVIWSIALVGEVTADRQLRVWRAVPANAGRTCRAGLWRYSRHPNYFFEWVHWLTYPVLAIGLPFGWTLWLDRWPRLVPRQKS
jgi:steroid 5-alpha reductase family enzyme